MKESIVVNALKALLANHWSSKGRDQKIQMKSIQKELQDRKNHRVWRVENGEHHVSNDFQCLEALRVEGNLELWITSTKEEERPFAKRLDFTTSKQTSEQKDFAMRGRSLKYPRGSSAKDFGSGNKDLLGQKGTTRFSSPPSSRNFWITLWIDGKGGGKCTEDDSATLSPIHLFSMLPAPETWSNICKVECWFLMQTDPQQGLRNACRPSKRSLWTWLIRGMRESSWSVYLLLDCPALWLGLPLCPSSSLPTGPVG